MYCGTRFRSRLEARWAAFFDLICLPWQDEPIDLRGYIPDFVVGSNPDHVVEVKQILTDDELSQKVNLYSDKIAKSGWTGRATILGVGPNIVVTGGMVDQVWACDVGRFAKYIYRDDATPEEGLIVERCAEEYCDGDDGFMFLGDEVYDFWNQAGNTVQWNAKVIRS